eukprot:6272770-Prymnesium_polylepis.1
MLLVDSREPLERPRDLGVRIGEALDVLLLGPLEHRQRLPVQLLLGRRVRRVRRVRAVARPRRAVLPTEAALVVAHLGVERPKRRERLRHHLRLALLTRAGAFLCARLHLEPLPQLERLE